MDEPLITSKPKEIIPHIIAKRKKRNMAAPIAVERLFKRDENIIDIDI